MDQYHGLFICTNCEHIGKPQPAGTAMIELVLWLCMFIPGLIYSLWRRARVKNKCGVCGTTFMVPVSSKRGSQMIKSDSVQAEVLATRLSTIDAQARTDQEIRKFALFIMLGIIAWGIVSWIMML